MDSSDFILENFEALGTLWFVETFENLDQNRRLEIKDYLEKYIQNFQNKYSRFLEGSLLNDLNHEKQIPFDEDLFEMINLGQKFSKGTENIFDLFIKKDLENIGYGKIDREEKILMDDEIVKSEEKVFVKIVKNIDGENEGENDKKKIFLNTNDHIDLGGIGKGYLIDKISQILKEKFALKYFLINGGGDIYLTSDHGKEIEIFLEKPETINPELKSLNNKNIPDSIFLKDKSFCASSSYKRRWKINEEEKNHFINKDDGGKRLVRSASFVISETATEADVLATVFCIMANDEDKMIKIKNNFPNSRLLAIIKE